MIYLDNAATTFPKSESVYQALDIANRELAFNAGRGSYKKARKAAELIEATKNQILELIAASDYASVVFTPSITVAINEILQGIEFVENDNIYISPYEHNAVARTIHLLEVRKNVNVIEIPLKSETLEIDTDKLKYMFAAHPPKCVCCTHISNVTGYVLPIKEIFGAAEKYNAITVLDTAQSLGVEPICSKELNISFLAFAGHKALYGPMGIGGFVDFKRDKLQAVIVGGTGSNSLSLDMPKESPYKYESSSCNIVAVAGLHAALKEVDIENNEKIEQELLEYLIEGLSEIDGVEMYMPASCSHKSIVSINLKKYKADEVANILDHDFDIAVRAGYHCAPLIHKWIKDEEYLGTVRISIGKFNQKNDVEEIVKAIKELCEE